MKRVPHSWQKKVLLILTFVGYAISCKTIEKDENNRYLRLANQYTKDGLYIEAIDNYQRSIQQNNNSLISHRNLGLVLVKMGNYRDAIKSLEKVIHNFSQDFETNYFLAQAYRARRRYADAIFHYRKCLTIRNDDIETLKALSWSYFRIRYYSESLKTTHKVLNKNNNDSQARIIIARTLIKLHRHQDALKVMQKAEKVGKEHEEPYFRSILGDIYYHLGMIPTAISYYKKSLKKEPLLAGALLGLGKCYLTRKRVKTAISLIEKSLRVRPSLVEAYWHLGKAYENINPEKAIKYLIAFQKHAATDPDYLSYLPEVNQKISMIRGQKKIVH